MSAGITNPCGYIDQPARARLGRMVTIGDRWPQSASGTTITVVPQYEKPGPKTHSQSQGARRRWRPKSRQCDAGDATPQSRQGNAGDGG
jgi:hypothetical protein